MYGQIRSEFVVDIHNNIINELGGLHGIKDYNALESSINNCFSTFFGEELYPTKEDKICNVFYLLIKNHCFNDANKRTAVSVFNILMKINCTSVQYELLELENLALDVAEDKLNQDDVKTWIKDHKIKTFE